MPAKKKYTPKQLRAAVKKYFESISCMKPVQVLTDSGRVNAKGMPVMIYKDAVNDRGKVILKRVYFVPPSVEGLCLFLGISRQTLHNWKNDSELGEEYGEIMDAAKLRIEEFLHQELNMRPKVAGIIFDLQCNYGWGGDAKDSDSGRTEVSYIPLPNGTGGEGDYDE